MGNPAKLSSWTNASGTANPCGSPPWRYVTCDSTGMVIGIGMPNTVFPNGPVLSSSLSGLVGLKTLNLRYGLETLNIQLFYALNSLTMHSVHCILHNS
jgi:hypothetical protein